MPRISVQGSSGSGKSRLSKALAEGLGAPYLELDSIFHLANWEPLPKEEFRRQVEVFAQQESWVIDGNYSAVRDLVLARAETLVFLDLPRWKVMSQLIPRTLRRSFTREELWNGNTEGATSFLSFNPDRNVILWSFLKHAKNRNRFAKSEADPGCKHITFQRFRSHAEGASWLKKFLGLHSQ
ncbi:MAG: adenylate kinase family enzyme [Planctomycetota bacterium]|jgi:adenylate kinase family enzyme